MSFLSVLMNRHICCCQLSFDWKIFPNVIFSSVSPLRMFHFAFSDSVGIITIFPMFCEVGLLLLSTFLFHVSASLFFLAFVYIFISLWSSLFRFFWVFLMQFLYCKVTEEFNIYFLGRRFGLCFDLWFKFHSYFSYFSCDHYIILCSGIQDLIWV